MPSPEHEIVIRGGTIYDGSGGDPEMGDMAIDGDTIVAVGRVDGRGRTEIDARGMAVAPGFINMLSWATESLIEDGRSQSDIRQGVTLEVFGEGWSMATGLYATMPPWVHEGGHDAWVKRLRDPSIRARVVDEMRRPAQGWENFLQAVEDADGILLASFKSERLKPLTGKTVGEVSRTRGRSAEDTIIDLVLEDESRVGAIYFTISEDNVKRQIALPWMSFGSDAASLAPEGVFLRSSPHPRAYGTFARLLGPYVRDQRVIPLAEAVRRLTSLPAANLGIERRGRLAPGMFADVVVFDPARIQDHATYERPHQYATGVSHVLVNGEVVLREGEHTGAKPGRVVPGRGVAH